MNSELKNIPQHIAIIMDGNGRWAEKRNLPRTRGHANGAKAVDVVVEYCAHLGVKFLTLYTFSSENWKRPENEVKALMNMLERMLIENRKKVLDNNIRFNVIGRIDRLPSLVRERAKDLMEHSSANSGMMLVLALSYGSRQEILDASAAICEKYRKGENDVSFLSGEENFEKFLYTAGLPDPDIIIRTGGEKRLSNFLLWQAAYAELYFTDVLWPDFNLDELKKALEEYQKRKRRFGG